MNNQERKAAVIKLWIEAQKNGQRQGDFCAALDPPIKARTLRAWMRSQAATDGAPPIEVCIAQLRQALASLDALARSRQVSEREGGPVQGASGPKFLKDSSPAITPAAVSSAVDGAKDATVVRVQRRSTFFDE